MEPTQGRGEILQRRSCRQLDQGRDQSNPPADQGRPMQQAACVQEEAHERHG
jgi:hypothetical protein